MTTAPTLDDCLTAYAQARGDLKMLEARAGKTFSELEDLQRSIREKRALVERLRTECAAHFPGGDKGPA
jgi:hypothetical protein